MSFEIGPIHSTPGSAAPARRAAPAAAPGFQATLAAAGRTAAPQDVVSVGIPATPPAEVLDAVGAAADAVDTMARENRELHFERDPESGRVVVQVRNLATREVVRTIPSSEALDLLSGGSA
jgi:flagellar protein FlaG